MSKILGILILIALFFNFINSEIGAFILTIIGTIFIFKIFGPTIISFIRKIIKKTKYK